jgi:hypothetical protein
LVHDAALAGPALYDATRARLRAGGDLEGVIVAPLALMPRERNC